jgi:hypothetical protein
MFDQAGVGFHPKEIAKRSLKSHGLVVREKSVESLPFPGDFRLPEFSMFRSFLPENVPGWLIIPQAGERVN